MEFKKCVKCKKEFPATTEFFYSKKVGEDYLRSRCKECSKLISKKHYKNNIEKELERSKKYRENNREKFLQYAKKHYKNNREKIREKAKERRKNNIEVVLKIERKSYKKNRVKILKRHEKFSKELTNSYVASQIGISIKNCPPEVIQTKRLTILLKRELNK